MQFGVPARVPIGASHRGQAPTDCVSSFCVMQKVEQAEAGEEAAATAGADPPPSKSPSGGVWISPPLPVGPSPPTVQQSSSPQLHVKQKLHDCTAPAEPSPLPLHVRKKPQDLKPEEVQRTLQRHAFRPGDPFPKADVKWSWSDSSASARDDELSSSSSSSSNRRARCFVCEECGVSLCSRQSLANHCARVHVKKEAFECGLCGRLYSSQRYLDNHMANQHNGSSKESAACAEADVRPKQEVLRCRLCGKLYSSQRFLDNHVLSQHSCGKESPCAEPSARAKQEVFECRLCGRLYSSRRYLDNHMVTQHGEGN